MKIGLSTIGPLLLFSSFFLPASAFSQGDLNPPAAPTPTMKTLQQVEPRTDLQATPAPVGVDTTNSAFHFIINQPGSYYLSANLGVTKNNGIRIAAEGVTLDLNGFEISRTSGSSGFGVEIIGTGNRAVVRSGSIRGFFHGILGDGFNGIASGCEFRELAVSACENGIRPGNGARVERCRLNGNTSTSIAADDGCSITHCVVFANVGGNAIATGDGASVTDCTVNGNTSSAAGISVGDSSTVARCTVTGNTVNSSAIVTGENCSVIQCTASGNTGRFGISVGNRSLVSDCNASDNTASTGDSGGVATGFNCLVRSCTASGNTSSAAADPNNGVGFEISNSSTIQNCTASNNEGDGIRVTTNVMVSNNTCSGNGFSASDGAGIHATGDDNRIEANNVISNDRGIDVDVAGNYIIKNSASGNTTNYDIAAGNIYGAIVDRVIPAGSPTPAPVSGNSATSSANTTDPWANISY